MKSLMFCLLAALPVTLHAAADEAEAIKFFETKVRPVFAENCYECHGEKKQKSGLRMEIGRAHV